MKILKGKNVGEQLKSADTILDRFSRRLHKTVVGVITPYPISNYVDDPIDGVVLRYMFPIGGEILLGSIHVEQSPKEGFEVSVVVEIRDGFKSEQFLIEKGSALIRPNIMIEAGSRLTVSVESKGSSEIHGIWVSILWVPKIKDAVIKQFLIDELDRIGEDNTK